MAEHIRFPQWRDEHEATRWPFAKSATLNNGAQTLLDGLFLDAVLYPIGGQERLYLSRVTVAHDDVTLYVGDAIDAERASCEFSPLSPPSALGLEDAYGRPAGLIVSEPTRLSLFTAWGAGDYRFEPEQTEFAAAVCMPTPEIGVRGIQLADGSLFTGDIWLVGGAGVVLSRSSQALPRPGQGPLTVTVIRVDLVGDPLFRRRLCSDAALFDTPRFLQTLTFTDGQDTVVAGPDAYGDVKLTANNDMATDTVLRIRPTPDGTVIEAVGTSVKGTR